MKSIYSFLFVPVIAVVFIGAVFLWIFTSSLPDKANNLIEQELTQVELMLNNTKAGLTDQVLDPSSLQELLSDSKRLLAKANSDSPAGWVVQLIGARKFTKALETIATDTDGLLTHFQTSGIPLTIHNIFEYAQEQVQLPIQKTVRTLHMVILVLALVLFAICIIVFFLVRNGAMSDPQIIMGTSSTDNP